MKIGIIVGSNRARSGSRKVADYCAYYLGKQKEEIELVDMHEVALPMWSEDMWKKESEQALNWEQYRAPLASCDGYIIIAAEWNGTVPPSLQNIIMHLDRQTVGHKPALLVGVSSGRGGSYPIAELKSSINKNNRMLLIPDYLIIREVENIFNTTDLDQALESDYYHKTRAQNSIDELLVYAKYGSLIREDLSFDYSVFKNGM
ncbi:MAG: NADPH-dependent FMN reductase [Patescibacteria group bacterium]